MLRSFCTPLGGVTNEALFKHVCNIVSAHASDGASYCIKVAALLREKYLKNLILVFVDPAHTLGNATKNAVKSEQTLGHLLKELFTDANGLIPKVQHSDVWAAKLEAAQGMLLRAGHGGPVTTILKHFSLALQRFASLSDPGIKFCCLLEASCLLLASVAGDSRQATPTRLHAEKLLDMINSANAFKIGLTTDYVLEAVRHVRLVEVGDHDPARTPGVVRDLVARLIVLYRDAFVAVRAPPGEPRMMKEIVMSQLAESRAIHYNGKV
jgi:hypothetical protein